MGVEVRAGEERGQAGSVASITSLSVVEVLPQVGGVSAPGFQGPSFLEKRYQVTWACS